MFSIRMVMFSYQAQNSGIMVKNYALNILRMQDKLRQHVIFPYNVSSIITRILYENKNNSWTIFFTAPLKPLL